MAAREAELRYQTLDELRIAYWEWGGRDASRPSLLFVHATSFHGRMFDPMIEAFDLHAISFEMRGHGRSDLAPVDHWGVVSRDLTHFVEALELTNLIGIGHSMGGHALVDAAAATDAFTRLVLLDPTIADPADYQDQTELTHPTARRRSRFESPEAMKRRLEGKGPFAACDPRILDDYCRFALAETDAGDYELLCRPETEAALYAGVHTNTSIHESVAALEIPVTLMRAKAPPIAREVVDFSDSPTWPDLAAAFRDAEDIYLPECNHFFPLEDPQRVVAVLQKIVG